MSAYDQSSQKPSKKGGKGRFAELGPAWITALATLIIALTGAGFFAGRASAPSQPTVQPTKFITNTVTATPAASPASSATGGDGTLLGSYAVTLPSYGSALLGPTAPTAAQILAEGSNGDIVWESGSGGTPLGTFTQDKIVSLPNGTTPTYAACKADALLSGSESYSPGTAFCIIETTGRMAGVTVESVNLSQNPNSIVLHVTVWTNSA